jgi:hypothetical protein
LRKAIKANDAQAKLQAEKALRNLGLKEPALKSFETHLRKNPDETYVQHAWKTLQADEQIKILKLMSPEERKMYWPLAHKDLRKKYNSPEAALQAP